MSRGTTKKKNFTMTVISNRKRFWVVKINAKLFTAPKSLEIKKMLLSHTLHCYQRSTIIDILR